MTSSVLVRAPSSTANLGPGYDVFGLALNAFYDEVKITKKGKGITIITEDSIPTSPSKNTAGIVVKELVKKFKIKMVFEDLHIEEWFDKIEATNALDSRKQLTDKAYGEKAGIDNYTGDVETNAETIPGGSSSKSMKFGADQEGKGGFEIKDNSKTSIK